VTPVIEVHRGSGGVWEAAERHILDSDDLDALVVEGLPTVQALVRVGGALRELTVYLEDEDDGWVTWTEAYGASS
jgi:hypothetical protein